MLIYGLPAATGFTISGSIQIGQIDPSNPLKAIMGVPYSFFYEQPKQAIRGMRSGEPLRAVEALSPQVIKNPLTAYRLATQGQHTISGKPINLPGEEGARKLKTWEAVGKSFGFQPLSAAKATDFNESIEALSDFVKDKKQSFANRYVNAMNAGDLKQMAKVRNEVDEWNDRWERAGKPEFRISLRGSIKSRTKPKPVPRTFKPFALEEKGLYQ